jgi:mRNA interferase MazF
MRRGEVWLADLDPHRGDEQGKRRPVVVVNLSSFGTLNLKVIVPITGWQASFQSKQWMVRIDPTTENGLTKASAADGFQVRSIDRSRFMRKLGELTDEQVTEIAEAIAAMVGA